MTIQIIRRDFLKLTGGLIAFLVNPFRGNFSATGEIASQSQTRPPFTYEMLGQKTEPRFLSMTPTLPGEAAVIPPYSIDLKQFAQLSKRGQKLWLSFRSRFGGWEVDFGWDDCGQVTFVGPVGRPHPEIPSGMKLTDVRIAENRQHLTLKEKKRKRAIA